MVATVPRRNVSVSLPRDLLEEVDLWAAAENTNRSSLLARLISQERRRRFEAELEQEYREATAEGFYDDIEFYLPAQAEVILGERD